jgi:hypothetical protein
VHAPYAQAQRVAGSLSAHELVDEHPPHRSSGSLLVARLCPYNVTWPQQPASGEWAAVYIRAKT